MKFLNRYHEFLKTSKHGKFVYQVESLLVALIVALIIRQFVVATFKIPSSSMENTLMTGDFLVGTPLNWGAKIPFVNRKMPAFTQADPGNVVIFKSPYPPYLDFIKRCVAVSGDTIQYINKQLYINGAKNDMHVDGAKVSSKIIDYRDNFGPWIVPSIGDTLKMIDGDIRNNTFLINLLKQENPDSDVYTKYSFIVDGKEMNSLNLKSREIFPTDLGTGLGIYEVPSRQLQQLHGVLPDVNISIKYKVFMDGEEITNYVTKTRCYFMMGDNRDNSEDSRFWGYVSDRGVQAKPLVVLANVGIGKRRNILVELFDSVIHIAFFGGIKRTGTLID